MPIARSHAANRFPNNRNWNSKDLQKKHGRRRTRRLIKADTQIRPIHPPRPDAERLFTSRPLAEMDRRGTPARANDDGAIESGGAKLGRPMGVDPLLEAAVLRPSSGLMKRGAARSPGIDL
jgi:hypothetical protein